MGSLKHTDIDYRQHPRVNSDDPVPPRPLPQTPAHIPANEADAIRVATALAHELAHELAREAHTLHDPVRWRFFHVGNWYLNGVHPPRNPWN